VTIAVYGANGYQGKLVTAELARQDLDLVMVGRDLTRLQDAAKASGVPDTELRQAATDDPTALAAAFRGVDVVINCAGPFTNSGVAVVRAAVEAGCHYLDTAGEQLYLQRIFDTVSPEAERAGVTVVPAMTDGGVPGDLIAHLLAERLGPLEELTTAHLITGNGEPPSRGSLRSGLVTLADLRQGGLRYADGVWTSGTPAGRTVMTFPGSAEPTPAVTFPLPEVVTVPRHVSVRRVLGVVEESVAARLSGGVSADVVDGLPEGPTAEGRSSQRFTVLVEAVSITGRHVRGVVTGADTYGTTAVIAAEGARRLAGTTTTRGVLAPAQAFDPSGFLNSLAPHGVTWTITPA